MKRVFSRLLLFISLVIFFIFSLLLLGGMSLYQYNQTDYKSSDHYLDIDVIVCLAGAKGRIEYSVQVWFDYWMKNQVNKDVKVPQLYISGMGEKSTWNTFLTFVPSHIQSTITEKDVLLETQSTNTEENAKFFSAHIKKHHWKNALLITSSYHMKRSHLIFKNEYKEVTFFPLALELPPFLAGEWFRSQDSIRITFSEFLKWLFYWGFYAQSS